MMYISVCTLIHRMEAVKSNCVRNLLAQAVAVRIHAATCRLSYAILLTIVAS